MIYHCRTGHCLSRFEAREHPCGSWADSLCSAVVPKHVAAWKHLETTGARLATQLLRTGIIQNEVCWRSNCPTLDIPSSSMMDTAPRSPGNLGLHCELLRLWCDWHSLPAWPVFETLRWAPRSIGHLRLDDSGGNWEADVGSCLKKSDCLPKKKVFGDSGIFRVPSDLAVNFQIGISQVTRSESNGRKRLCW